MLGWGHFGEICFRISFPKKTQEQLWNTLFWSTYKVVTKMLVDGGATLDKSSILLKKIYRKNSLLTQVRAPWEMKKWICEEICLFDKREVDGWGATLEEKKTVLLNRSMLLENF
jgi:hypothetical protein